MAKKSKYTEGVLARDGKDSNGSIMFFLGVGRPDVSKDAGGWWLCHGESRSWPKNMWTEEEWLALYKKSDMPRRGSAVECELEL